MAASTRRKRRKRREGEVICRCFAYRFPHRQLGGRCNGSAFVAEFFENYLHGYCRDCHFLVAPCAESDYSFQCQVLEGLDKLLYCPALREHVDYHRIRLYGVNGPDKHTSL